ncbi:MAG: hypothetical protein A3H35_17660 [Betaproteobacteria bacterium RIFCSPLOWO2_02_FULL_62_17]|nr:MAG: hypothetical protein A3H35_17660 [Betaproteobacteria bacterium RIFCSPLOWO2_02_FULL_62_17]
MKPFFSSLSPHEIYHLRNLLQSAGIPCRIHNEHLASLAGEVPFTECAAQLILDRDQDRDIAELILKDWRESARRSGPGWTCPECAEAIEEQFTACWKCGQARRSA